MKGEFYINKLNYLLIYDSTFLVSVGRDETTNIQGTPGTRHFPARRGCPPGCRRSWEMLDPRGDSLQSGLSTAQKECFSSTGPGNKSPPPRPDMDLPAGPHILGSLLASF